MKSVKEYEVPCGWCGAKEGDPCVNLERDGAPYLDGTVHRPRAWRFEGIRPDTW